MKMFFVTLAAVMTTATYSSACPDLSGEYVSDAAYTYGDGPFKDINDSFVIEQSGCDSVKITHTKKVEKNSPYPDSTWTYTKTRKIDGNKYEGVYSSLTPAKDNSIEFNTTEFFKNRIVLTNFSRRDENCSGRYSYFSFRCEMWQQSFGYNEHLQMFTRELLGRWQGQDGRSEYYLITLRKIR